MHSICVWDMIKQSKPLQTRYDMTYIYDRYYIRTHVYMFLFNVKKKTCLNYCEFDLEGDLVGVPHTWNLSAQPFITLIKLVWREYDIVAMNEWKKKCVGLQRTWVSKRTVPWNVILAMWFFAMSVWKRTWSPWLIFTTFSLILSNILLLSILSLFLVCKATVLSRYLS